MQTELFEVDPLSDNRKLYARAAEALGAGALVGIPTETVYGLGADALNPEAVARIFEAKGRPSFDPLIIHVHHGSEVEKYTAVPEGLKDLVHTLASRFWPGPLTMIVRKNDKVPYETTGGMDTVAVRMPNHPVALELIRRSGGYIAAPSANISGKPSPTRGEHVIHDMKGRIDMIIVDDTVDIGVESTIVDLSEDVPTILRPGYITKEMLSEVLGEVRIDPAIMGSVKPGVVPKAPGMKYKHYAPDADLAIVEGDIDKVVDKINALTKEKEALGYRVGIMATQETKDRYESGVIKVVGSRKDEATVAHNLYAALREFDKQQVAYIYSEGFSENQVGQAVMNRLIKAAGHTIINV